MLISPSTQSVKKWSRAEFVFKVNDDPAHFTKTWLTATFKNGAEEKRVRGFYNDNGQFVIRFMPQREGDWTFRTHSNLNDLCDISGLVECLPADSNESGPVVVEDRFHFKYANGKPYYPFGTTAYVWNHQDIQVQQQTLASLASAPFNKIRMCVFPKHYTYNFKEPKQFPFPGNIENGFDYSRFNCAFFEQLEDQIDALKQLGIEADLIIFHPYDRWGFSKMEADVDHRYVEYLVSRLASFSNVWWSLANEFDLLKDKNLTFWQEVLEQICREDPFEHLVSIHNWHTPPLHYTNNDHWFNQDDARLTHASIQHHDLWFIPQWRHAFQKPIVIDECRYEGDIDCGWGSITAQKMVHLFWEGVCSGGYVTHGESYLSDDEIIWWSHGGVLKGESSSRIAFLRQIVEDGEPKRLSSKRMQKNAQWDALIGYMGDEYFLIWLGESQPAFKLLTMLPEDKAYSIEVIDSWEMTITPLPGAYRTGDRVNLPAKPGIAIRARLAS